MNAGTPRATLLLGRGQVAALIDLAATIPVVEAAFAGHARGGLPAPGILGIQGVGGGVHVKAAAIPGPDSRIAVKLNSNFPGNARHRRLPTIQGAIALFDGASGFPLAVMDSIEITILRTAAATAVAAKWLAREDADTVTICGCGAQALAQLRAVAAVRPLGRAFLYDLDRGRAERLAGAIGPQGPEPIPVTDLHRALGESLLVVTCTPSRQAFLGIGDISAGTFVAAVGADSEEKQELDTRLVASATLVVDLLEPCATIGELHHALAAGLMTREDVHAELGQVVAGLRPGRRSPDEIVVFDSTGTALQDAATACLAYERAIGSGVGTWFEFGGAGSLPTGAAPGDGADRP